MIPQIHIQFLIPDSSKVALQDRLTLLALCLQPPVMEMMNYLV